MSKTPPQLLVPRLITVGSLLVAGCAGTLEVPPVARDSAAPLLRADGGSTPASGADAGSAAPGTIGGACPCPASLTCHAGTCRQPCIPSGPCNRGGGCGATRACAALPSGAGICVPGAAEGESCGSTPCRAGLLCLGTTQGGASGRCFASCTSPGAPCTGGGTCYATADGTCSYCY